MSVIDEGTLAVSQEVLCYLDAIPERQVRSSGTFADLTLARRRDQAAALIEACVPPRDSVALVGFSMSGQTAADVIVVAGAQ
ncbi:hypothetical protein [Catenulispora yoronensis]